MRDDLTADAIQDSVRDRYGRIARERAGNSGGCCASTACYGDSTTLLGYTEEQIAAVPEGADLGLGCGTPLAFAFVREGETVLDLGSGAGFDCFLAAREVGPGGHVIGVDMTEEMIPRAMANAEKGGFGNVEFRLGKLEELPVGDSSVDVVISNCVINLCPDKRTVFREAFRVLNSRGRVAVSDVVTPIPLPEEIKRDLSLHTGCLAGASLISELREILEECGFANIGITPKSESRAFIKDWAPGLSLEDFVVSAVIQAEKP